MVRVETSGFAKTMTGGSGGLLQRGLAMMPLVSMSFAILGVSRKRGISWRWRFACMADRPVRCEMLPGNCHLALIRIKDFEVHGACMLEGITSHREYLARVSESLRGAPFLRVGFAR